MELNQIKLKDVKPNSVIQKSDYDKLMSEIVKEYGFEEGKRDEKTNQIKIRCRKLNPKTGKLPMEKDVKPGTDLIFYVQF